MKNLSILSIFCFATLACNAQLREKQQPHSFQSTLDFSSSNANEDDERGFTFGIDLGVYLASRKTAGIYNGAGGRSINTQSIWYDVETRLAEVGVNAFSNTVQNINNEYPEYNNGVTGFDISGEDLPLNMGYSPKLYFGLGATYHFSQYWALVAKSSLANLKATDVYTMTLIGPTLPQNASEVIGIFDITGEEQRLHLDLGFKNTSYNDYGFKWFWGAGASVVGSKISNNVAWIGDIQYPLLISSATVQSNNPQAFEAIQTAYNIGYYATTGWEMEYDERYDFGIGFVLSRDPIELAGDTQTVFNKRIYITFGI